MLFEDPQQTLYIVLAISVALLTVFLCVALLYLILVLRDANKILDKTRDTVEKVNDFVIKPVKLATMIVDNIRPMIERVLEHTGTLKKKKRRAE